MSSKIKKRINMWLKRKNGLGFRRIYNGKTIDDFTLSELRNIINRKLEEWGCHDCGYTYKIRSKRDYEDVKSHYWNLVVEFDLLDAEKKKKRLTKIFDFFNSRIRG